VVAPAWVRPFLPLRGLLQYLDRPDSKSPKIRRAVEAAESAVTRG
jgi:hypothetical protein